MKLGVKLASLILFGSTVAVFWGQTSSASNSRAVGAGIAVESVAKNFEGEKAGLQEGDILLQWVRGDVHGELESAFDLVTVEIEQSPRGPVTVQGLRGNISKEWQLGQDEWRIQARPNFTDTALVSYQQGKELAAAGKLAAAAETWRALAGETDRPAPAWLRSWLLFQLAQMNAEARDWTECDRAYQEALQASPNQAEIATQVQRSWGMTFMQRIDWPNADRHFRQALALEQAAGNERLALAMILDDLGALALNRGDPSEAESYYTRALHVRESLAPGSSALVSSLNHLSDLAVYGGHLDAAEDLNQRAFALAEKLAPAGLSVAAALNILGNVALNRGKLSLAKDSYARALQIDSKLEPGSLCVAAAINGLGRVAWATGDLDGADQYYSQALEIRRKLAPDSGSVAATVSNLGLVAMERGDFAKAEEYLRESLDIKDKLAPGSLPVASTFNNLGLLAWHRGDLAKADSYGRSALAIREKLAPGSLDVATSLNNLGLISWQRGDLVRADRYHRRALAIRERLAPGSLEVAMSFDNLMLVALERGDLTQAQQLSERGYAIYQRLSPGSLGVARALNNLGLVARQRGDLAKAEEDFRQALSIREKLVPVSVDTAWNLNRLALVVGSRGDLKEAEGYYRKAIALWEKLAPESSNQADAEAGLAAIRRRQGQPEEASQFYDRSLKAIEGQSARLGGSFGAQADFRAARENYYREYIDLLLVQGKPEQALEVLERSRARALLEILSTAHLAIRNGVNSELIKKERSLQADINAKSERRMHLLSEKQSDVQIKAVEKDISALTNEYQDVQGQIRSNSPAYAALTQPEPLSTKEIQEQLLDPETVLLEYSLGDERSHVFVVSSHSLEVFELPKRTVIEAASRRVYELLTARNRRYKGERPAQQAARIAQADAEYPNAAARLSQVVLKPIAGKLRAKRLLIVSDGALHFIPFAALPVPARGTSQLVPLVARHEIVNLPSASVLAVLRRERIQRQPAAKTVAVLADPVFDRADARVKPDQAAGLMRSSHPGPGVHDVQAVEVAQINDVSPKDVGPAENQESAEMEESLESNWLTRSAADVGWQRTRGGEVYLPRLPSTRKEAGAIVVFTPPGQSFVALDFKANRATATSAALANYRIVHFATHALLNSKHPELSGLVLSLVDERGRPQSGFLGLEDIYNLNLPVELVVLSACETALGKGVEGEGIVGLTRGFMYAGASRVMASLWNIDDRATADQMKYFYRALVGRKMRPAAALRAAQLKMRQDPRWSSPYFWATFQIQGEWK